MWFCYNRFTEIFKALIQVLTTLSFSFVTLINNELFPLELTPPINNLLDPLPPPNVFDNASAQSSNNMIKYFTVSFQSSL